MNQHSEAQREDKGMHVLDHLGELRRRVVYCLIVFVAGLVGGLFGAKPMFDYLVADAPVDNLNLHVFSPWDAISLYMKFAILISLVIAIPFTLFQLWAFVKPGLAASERRATLRYVPGALLMFLMGISFAYFIVFPMAYLFTGKVTASMGLAETYGVTQYFDFLFNIVFPISLLFELPLIILFLTRIGILNPNLLVRMRRVAWFIMILIGVTITPPDVISDLLVAIPLVLLYELSVLLAKAAYRKRIAVRADKDVPLNDD